MKFSYTILYVKDVANSNLPQEFQENSLSKLSAGIEIGFVTEDVAATFVQALIGAS